MALTNRERQARWYARQQAAGRCVGCGGERVAGRAQCARCLAGCRRRRLAQAARQKAARGEG